MKRIGKFVLQCIIFAAVWTAVLFGLGYFHVFTGSGSTQRLPGEYESVDSGAAKNHPGLYSILGIGFAGIIVASAMWEWNQSRQRKRRLRAGGGSPSIADRKRVPRVPKWTDEEMQKWLKAHSKQTLDTFNRNAQADKLTS
jgi:hypothetical protein